MTVCGLGRALFAQSEFDVPGFYHFPLAGLDERFRRGELALLHWTSVFWVRGQHTGPRRQRERCNAWPGLSEGEPLWVGDAARLAERVAECQTFSAGVASGRVAHRCRSHAGWITAGDYAID